jgi:hypothetical protein
MPYRGVDVKLHTILNFSTNPGKRNLNAQSMLQKSFPVELLDISNMHITIILHKSEMNFES